MQATISIRPCDVNKLIKQMVVLVDTREQKNDHITGYFDHYGIAWRPKALETVDYSAELPANPELGLPFSITLEGDVGIERKNSLTEIAGNFTQGRAEFKHKWQLAKETVKYRYLIIEGGSWEDIIKENYRTKFTSNAFYNSLLSWRERYGIYVDFVPHELTALHILRILQDKLRKKLEE